MPVSVLRSAPRDDGTVEVTLYQDGVRFTAVVPDIVAQGEHAYEMYQAMADRMCAEQERVREIAQPGRPEREA